jgi:uncharacterized protein DUF3291
VTTFHLAQFNVARLVAPLDSPELAGFVAQLGAINALAEAAPGFLWRFQTDAGDATALRPYEDERIIVNFSVWTTPEALHEFVYRTAHAAVMARRREWFERLTDAFLVLWWVPAGHHPTIQEAIAHLETLRRLGDSPEAFSFKRLFPAPSLGAGVAHDTVEDAASG